MSGLTTATRREVERTMERKLMHLRLTRIVACVGLTLLIPACGDDSKNNPVSGNVQNQPSHSEPTPIPEPPPTPEPPPIRLDPGPYDHDRALARLEEAYANATDSKRKRVLGHMLAYARKGPNKLIISENRSEKVPPEFALFQEIEYLQIHGSSFTSLPPEIGNFSRLKTLIIRGTQITSLPPELGNLQSLEDILIMENRKLTQLPAEIGKLSNLEGFRWVSNGKIRSIPKEIGQLAKLTRLIIHECRVGELPPEVWQLTNLTKLHCVNVGIEKIPADIGKLTNLTEIRLSRNQIKTIPAEIGNLKKLKTMYLDNNPLYQIPFREMKSMTELKALYLMTTDVPMSSITELRLALPKCNISK